MTASEGPIHTHGASFRARAEAAQRRFRADVLGVPHGTYRGRPWGHILDEEHGRAGLNFVHPAAHRALLLRAEQGKGVDLERSQQNMLSSQALCFNLFAPLVDHDDVASRVFRLFCPALASVRRIAFEYTPPSHLLGDQFARGGVDHDLLVEYVTNDGSIGLLAIEMKFVEESFSCCGFRPGRRDTCPDDVPVAVNRDSCLYVKKRRYLYWQRSDELGVLGEHALISSGCPFSGPLWQLWVNTVLVQALASERHARATFAVCAPAANDALLGPRKDVVTAFKDLIAPGIDFTFVALEDVLNELHALSWSVALDARYRIAASPARKAKPSPASR